MGGVVRGRGHDGGALNRKFNDVPGSRDVWTVCVNQ